KTMLSLYRIALLVPFNMMNVWCITDIGVYELFGKNIPPFIFLPIFAVVATTVLILLTYQSAKQHQVK
ncbi:MAG: ABC transporter permease, partial [Cellulosilyticum sp.]|nr:ABC transporter permease [Cellulosilyticum sp.]